MLFAYCRKVTLFLYVRVIETEQEHLKTETTLWNQREVTKESWNTPKSSWVIFVFSKQILGCLIWHSPSMSKVLLLHFHFKVYVRKRGQLCNAVLNFFLFVFEKKERLKLRSLIILISQLWLNIKFHLTWLPSTWNSWTLFC